MCVGVCGPAYMGVHAGVHLYVLFLISCAPVKRSHKHNAWQLLTCDLCNKTPTGYHGSQLRMFTTQFHLKDSCYDKHTYMV